MKIDYFDWKPRFVEKLELKHQVSVNEVEELFFIYTQFRKAGKGKTKGEDLYQATGQTRDGRYLIVYFIYKPRIKTAMVISARDMDGSERRSYERRK